MHPCTHPSIHAWKHTHKHASAGITSSMEPWNIFWNTQQGYQYPHVVHRPLSPLECCCFQICILRCLFDIPVDYVTDNSHFTKYHLPEKLPTLLNCVYVFPHLQASCIPLLYLVATHSSILAWRILWTEEPGGLLSMGSHRVAHDWSNLACMRALGKEMATHSSVLAWRIPGTEEPGGLPSMGSHRVGHDWSDLAAAAILIYFVCYF